MMFDNQKDFFAACGKKPAFMNDLPYKVTIEDLYQAFKARLIDEVKAVHSTESPLSGNGWETYEYFEYPLIDISGEAGADLVEKE